MVWNSAWDSAWLSMFPKKHMPEHITQKGGHVNRRRGRRKTEDLVLNISNTWQRLPLPLPLLFYGPERDGLISQTSPRGQEEMAAPKIVDQCPSASTPSPRVDFVSEVGLDPSMGSVLHCSSKHSTSLSLCPTALSLSVWLSACDVQLCRHRR